MSNVRTTIEQIRENDPSLTDLRMASEDYYRIRTDLPDSLSANTTLRSLDLMYSRIGDEYTESLAGALLLNDALRKLDLSFNNIGDHGAIALAQLLSGNTALHSLGLRKNRIGSTGAIALADALKDVNKTLTELDLSNNDIGDRGAKALGDALRVNASLRSLNIAGNRITYDGLHELVQALLANTILISLNIGDIYYQAHHHVDLTELELINSCLERNRIIKQFTDAAEYGDVVALLDLLVELKKRYPKIDDPISPNPSLLAEIYRNYRILHPSNLSPSAVIALLTKSDPYPYDLQDEVNKALTSYLYANVQSFPADIQKNGFRMILWLLRDHWNDCEDKDLETIMTMSARGTVSAVDYCLPLRSQAAFLPTAYLSAAEIKGIEDDKLIIIEQLISMQSPEAQLSYRCDALVKQVAALAHRLKNKSFSKVIEYELKMRLYSSTPEGTVYSAYKDLCEYQALSDKVKFTAKELTRLESILKSLLLVNERSQFLHGDVQYTSEIAELKTIMSTIDKLKDLNGCQVQLEWEQKLLTELLVQQVSDLSKCTDKELSIELAQVLHYLSKPDKSLTMEYELTWLEATISRRQDELANQPRVSNAEASSDLVSTLELESKFNAEQIRDLSWAVESDNELLASQVASLPEKCPQIGALSGIYLAPLYDDKELSELTIELDKGIRHCLSLQLYGHLATLDHENRTLNNYRELVKELKKIEQRCQDALRGDLRLLYRIHATCKRLKELVKQIEADAKVCRSRLHSYGSFAIEVTDLAEGVKSKRNELTNLVIEIKDGLQQLSALEEGISRWHLRSKVAVYLSPEQQFVPSRLTILENALSRRRHDASLQRHYYDDIYAREKRVIDDSIASIMQTIARIKAYKNEIDFFTTKARMTTLAKMSRSTNEIDALAAIPPTIAKIRSLQVQVNVEQALARERKSLVNQIAELSECMKSSKSGFSLTIFNKNAKTSDESMRKIFDAYLAKESAEQLTSASLDQLTQDLQVRLEYVSAPSRMQYHEAEIALLSQVIQTTQRIMMIQAPVVLPTVSAAALAAVSASLAPPRAGM